MGVHPKRKKGLGWIFHGSIKIEWIQIYYSPLPNLLIIPLRGRKPLNAKALSEGDGVFSSSPFIEGSGVRVI
tara:strand:- start:448 stop:663 length:216 start_codon:yes stop_codon:yes gene_type:complete